MTTRRLVRLTLLGLLLGSAPTFAQVTCPGGAFTWNDGAGTWATGANWTPVGPPTAGADVCFNTATANPTLPAGTTTVGTVNVLSSGALTLTGGALRTFSINGGINADGPFTFNNITNVSPTASQTWLINGSGSTFNSPLSVPVATAATTTITATGTGDLTFNNAAPRGFQAFNWGAGVLVLNANGLGAGTPITLSGANSALLIGSAAALNLDNPVTAATSGELLAVDGNAGVRQSMGLLTIAPGVTLEELVGGTNNVQAQPAGLTLGAGSTLLKQTFGGIYVNGSVSDTATSTLNLFIGLITPTGSQLDEGLHFLTSTTVNSIISSTATGNSAMIGADGATTLTLSGGVNLGAAGRLILIPRSGATILFGPSSFSAPGNPNDIQLRGTAGNAVELTNSAVTANGISVFDGLSLQTDSNPPPPTVTFSTTGGATWRVRNAAQTLSGALNLNAAGTVDTGTDLTISGVLAGAGALTKAGAGSLILGAGAHTHSGGITVNAGTLQVDGTLNGEGTIAINNGGGLAGAGTLQSGTGPITIAGGGRYTAGSGGAGNLTTNDLSLSDTSTLTFTVGTATTQGIVNGALILDGILNINQGAGFAQGTFTLFTATGAITNNSLRQGSVPTGFSFDYQVSGNTVLLKVGPGATAVELVAMEAVTDGTSTAVTWQAGTELRNLGYRVYRQEGARRQEVSGLIAGAALRGRADAFASRSYSFVDSGDRSGARYWVEAIDLKGARQWLGPVDVARGPSSKVRVRSAAAVAQLQPAALAMSGGPMARPMDPPGLDRSLGDADLRRQWKVAASSGAVKLLVRRDGVYHVSADQLFQAGLPAGTSLGNLQLWRGGHPVAFRVVSADGRSLQAGDAIEFFGQAADTLYTDAHVYWVTAGLGVPRSMRAAPLGTATATASSFLETLEIRERTNHITALQNAKTDQFFGPPIIGTTPLQRVFSTPALALLSSDPAVLEVTVQGLTSDLHALDVTVNGLRVGTIHSVFQDVATARFALPPGTLVLGDNKVELVGQTDTEIALEISQRLTYPRLFSVSGPLRFTVAAGQEVLLSKADASTRVLDITDALNPAILATTASGNGVRLIPGGSGTRILYAYRDQDVLVPGVIANVPSSWNQSEGSDLVIIAPRTLHPSLRALVEQRTAEGLRVAVVDIEDVYDEFSAGEKDAIAIRSFLATALERWDVAPRFVLLAGAATYDPRGWFGEPELDQVPTVQVQTRVQAAASDDVLVTFDPASGPALAIGRLPLSTPDAMAAAVAKIVGRRLAGKNDQLLLVRDRDSTFNFSAASSEVGAALSGWQTQTFARGPDESANHSSLLDALRKGPVVVDYQGHGAERIWASGMLSTADIDALSGTGTSALVAAATCLNAFVDLDRESLGPALLRTPGGGAWGVWASSAFSVPTEHALFTKTVLSAVMNDGISLGEATLKAKQAVTDPDVRATFHLLGDPSARAVATRKAALTVGTPKSTASGCSTPGGPLSALAPLVLAALAWSLRRRRPA